MYLALSIKLSIMIIELLIYDENNEKINIKCLSQLGKVGK